MMYILFDMYHVPCGRHAPFLHFSIWFKSFSARATEPMFRIHGKDSAELTNSITDLIFSNLLVFMIQSPELLLNLSRREQGSLKRRPQFFDVLAVPCSLFCYCAVGFVCCCSY